MSEEIPTAKNFLQLLIDEKQREIDEKERELKRLKVLEMIWGQQAQSVPQEVRDQIDQIAKGILEMAKSLSAPITILFLAANPAGTTELDLNKERNIIEDELDRGEFGKRFNLENRFELKPDEISRILLKHSPQIVHFSGHGSDAGEIILQDSTGEAHPVGASAIEYLFSILKDKIRCVVLNACYSEHQAMLISKYIDCVIGMSKAIGDTAALSFAQGFYRGIGYGRDLETAFNLGCLQITIEGLKEEDTPKIIWKDNEPKKIILV